MTDESRYIFIFVAILLPTKKTDYENFKNKI
jgi:hypothetical protein